MDFIMGAVVCVMFLILGLSFGHRLGYEKYQQELLVETHKVDELDLRVHSVMQDQADTIQKQRKIMLLSETVIAKQTTLIENLKKIQDNTSTSLSDCQESLDYLRRTPSQEL